MERIVFKKLGAFLKAKRLKAGKTQAEAAKKCRFKSAQSISDVERGKSGAPNAMLKTLVRFYGVDQKLVIKVILEAKRAELAALFNGRTK